MKYNLEIVNNINVLLSYLAIGESVKLKSGHTIWMCEDANIWYQLYDEMGNPKNEKRICANELRYIDLYQIVEDLGDDIEVFREKVALHKGLNNVLQSQRKKR